MRLLITLLLLLDLSVGFGAEARFPKPDFETGYRMPGTATPAPRTLSMEYLDVGVLVAALSLASWLALKKRSRKGIFLLTIFSLIYFGFWRKGCICPVGSTQNVVLSLFDSSYALPVTVLAFFILPLLFALFFGRVFCGAVCPLGAAQDLVALKPLRMPRPLAVMLGTIPCVYLGLAVLLAATGTGFIICRLDPFVSFFRLSGTAGILVMGTAFLLAGVLIARPYCRFFCPYGVLLDFMSRFSAKHLTITPDECVKCRLCEDSCPFGAIREPAPEYVFEPARRGVRRLAILLLALPLLIAGGAWAMAVGAASLAHHSPAVALAEQVQMEDSGRAAGTTLESEAFRGTGKPVSQLYDEASKVRRQTRIGGAFVGGFLGLVFGLRLAGLSVRRKRQDYEPDRGTCFSCGRCFEYCPKEQERLKKK